MGRERLDLTPALRDGYLRRLALGPGGEPAELWIHRLRCVLEPGASEQTRVLALRLEGVAALVTLAVRVDAEEGGWNTDERDWVGALRTGAMLPPVLESCTIDAGLERRAYEWIERDGTWWVGDPARLWRAIAAPDLHLLELRASGAITPECESRFRVIAAFASLRCLERAGPCSVDEVLEAAARWEAARVAYQRRRRECPETPFDPQFEIV